MFNLGDIVYFNVIGAVATRRLLCKVVNIDYHLREYGLEPIDPNMGPGIGGAIYKINFDRVYSANISVQGHSSNNSSGILGQMPGPPPLSTAGGPIVAQGSAGGSAGLPGGLNSWLPPLTAQPTFIGLDKVSPLQNELKGTFHDAKCECGSSSVGSSKHSDYCPLHDPKA